MFFCNFYIIHYITSHSIKCKVWRASRDADVKNHNLGGVIARNTWQGREVKVQQFHVKSEVQTFRTESSVDFKSDSGH